MCGGGRTNRAEILMEILGNETLDNYHIPPDTVELSVSLIDSHFAKAKTLDQSAAGGVLDEDARDQFPEAGFSGGVEKTK
jgi:hypothetical protein